MQETKRRVRGRPPAFKPGELGEFLERKVILEIDQEIARLQSARDAIVKGAKDARPASQRRS